MDAKWNCVLVRLANTQTRPVLRVAFKIGSKQMSSPANRGIESKLQWFLLVGWVEYSCNDNWYRLAFSLGPKGEKKRRDWQAQPMSGWLTPWNIVLVPASKPYRWSSQWMGARRVLRHVCRGLRAFYVVAFQWKISILRKARRRSDHGCGGPRETEGQWLRNPNLSMIKDQGTQRQPSGYFARMRSSSGF